MVSASDCGSEGRGFDSHHPPHKNKGYPTGYPLFLSDEGSRTIKCSADERCRRASCEPNLYFRQRRKCKRLPSSTLNRRTDTPSGIRCFLLKKPCHCEEGFARRGNLLVKPSHICRTLTLYREIPTTPLGSRNDTVFTQPPRQRGPYFSCFSCWVPK